MFKRYCNSNRKYNPIYKIKKPNGNLRIRHYRLTEQIDKNYQRTEIEEANSNDSKLEIALKSY